MSEIKPVLTANERVLNQYGRDTHLASDAVYIKEYANEVAELRAALEAQTKRANALALVIRDLTKMVTHDAEAKDQFIERVKKILSVDPDLRVSEFESALEALQKENARLKEELRQYQTSHRSAMPRRFK